MEVKKNAFRLVRGRLAFVDESVIYKKNPNVRGASCENLDWIEFVC